MKKILIFSIALAGLTYAGCKKRDSYDVSTVQPESYPTITFTGSKFVSIPVGGTLPNISVSAYDSLYNEVCTVEQGELGVDVTTPGLYFQEFVARNSKGFQSTDVAYVAVTDIDPSFNLAGTYVRAATGYQVTVEEVANGLYSTSNFFGVVDLDAKAYFVQVGDTLIDMPTQPTDLGSLTVSNTFLRLDPDTSFGFVMQTITSNRTVRKFDKVN